MQQNAGDGGENYIFFSEAEWNSWTTQQQQQQQQVFQMPLSGSVETAEDFFRQCRADLSSSFHGSPLLGLAFEVDPCTLEMVPKLGRDTDADAAGFVDANAHMRLPGFPEKPLLPVLAVTPRTTTPSSARDPSPSTNMHWAAINDGTHDTNCQQFVYDQQMQAVNSQQFVYDQQMQAVHQQHRGHWLNDAHPSTLMSHGPATSQNRGCDKDTNYTGSGQQQDMEPRNARKQPCCAVPPPPFLGKRQRPTTAIGYSYSGGRGVRKQLYSNQPPRSFTKPAARGRPMLTPQQQGQLPGFLPSGRADVCRQPGDAKATTPESVQSAPGEIPAQRTQVTLAQGFMNQSAMGRGALLQGDAGHPDEMMLIRQQVDVGSAAKPSKITQMENWCRRVLAPPLALIAVAQFFAVFVRYAYALY